MDAIGDYILFRNLIEAIKSHGKYRGYDITLCANTVCRELAEKLDSQFVSQFIWIDKRLLRDSLTYALKIAHRLRKENFAVAIHPSFTRDVLSDLLVRVTNAPVRIGHTGGIMTMMPHQEAITDKYYTVLVNTGQKTMFEFYRNRKFVSLVIGEEIDLARPTVSVEGLSAGMEFPEKFAVLFPGANFENRQWGTKNFAMVSDYLSDRYGLQSYVCGGREDKRLYEEIAFAVKSSQPKDMTGRTLLDLGLALSRSTITITNDTVAAHMGAAVNAKVVSLLNGRHFGRFSPYPKEVWPHFISIYPEKIMKEIDASFDWLTERYRSRTDVRIKDIRPDSVIGAIDKLLKEGCAYQGSLLQESVEGNDHVGARA
jgi:ADP-heptose:LPS heptosyltransferase